MNGRPAPRAGAAPVPPAHAGLFSTRSAPQDGDSPRRGRTRSAQGHRRPLPGERRDSETDPFAAAKEVGVDPVHVLRALEQERQLEAAKEAALLEREVRHATRVERRPYRLMLWISAALFGFCGVFMVYGGIELFLQESGVWRYAFLAFFLLFAGLLFYPAYTLVLELRRTWRRRRTP